MRRFLTGLLIGIVGMYWYAYQKDTFFDQVRVWLTVASHDSGASQKVDKMMPRKR